jgi:hypothetical protein
MCAPFPWRFRIGGWGSGRWTPLTNALFTSPASDALNCPRPIIMSGICGSVQAAGALGRQHPPGGPPSTSSTSVVAAAGPLDNTPQGGPPSTYSTSVVAAAGPAASTPQGTRHQRLQLRWWPLPDLPLAPPGGPPSTSSTSVVAAAGPPDSTAQGAHRQRLPKLGTCH